MLVWMRAFSVFGLVLIGSYSHEFGPRRVSIYLLICSAVLMLLLFTCPTKFFGVTLALLSTCVEAALMPINALTQGAPESLLAVLIPVLDAGVDVARAGRVNTLFRAVDIGAHIVVPLVFTSSTWGVVSMARMGRGEHGHGDMCGAAGGRCRQAAMRQCGCIA